MVKVTALLVVLAIIINKTYCSDFETCEDEKCYKNLLKTRPSLMIVYSKNDKEAKEPLKLFSEISKNIKDIATIAYVNCDEAKKLCKKLKINPTKYELKYYRDGSYSKDYDRQFNKKSLINFFNDPTELPWEEEENSKDVVHLKDETALNKLIRKHKVGILIMFYAPWCGYCKKLKPEFSAAASELKQSFVLAGMNLDTSENMHLKTFYNISGYPTLLYFKSGSLQFQYGGGYDKQGIIDWLQNPEAPKEKEAEMSWADEENVHVTFLTDDNFDSFIKVNPSVLVMFYAPWCGHCKHMKPDYNKVAERLKTQGHIGILAAVDATKEKKIAERFKLQGFPTLKYFKNGKFAWDVNERTEDKLYEFMMNPKQPPPPEPEWSEQISAVKHLTEEDFGVYLKTKKHALVMFYAPWCGHCKTAKPHYTQAANDFEDDPKVAFTAVDCTKMKILCEQNGVKGFPTIIYFNFGKNPKPYEGGREYKDFVKFMKNPNDPNVFKHSQIEEWEAHPGYEHVNFLDDTNFDEFINTKPKVLVMFYAPWCGHCKTMKPAYAEAAVDLKRFLPGAYLAAVDATQSRKLAATYSINGFPTLKYFENGVFKYDYEGGRKKDDFVEYMREPKAPKQVQNTEL